MKLTIALLQLLPTGSLKGNMEKGIKACFQAKEKGADIAIFPEMWSCGYVFPHEEASLRECAIPRYGSFVKRFAELAAELDMAIAITFLEQHEPKPRNTVCLFDRHGKIQYCYSKVHICNFGEEDDESVLDAGDDLRDDGVERGGHAQPLAVARDGAVEHGDLRLALVQHGVLRHGRRLATMFGSSFSMSGQRSPMPSACATAQPSFHTCMTMSWP